jgi:hypothetical protein
MAERNPLFELHIRPLFRLLDRQHMLRIGPQSLDLWDYDAVKAKSALILQRVKGQGPEQAMPTLRTGGPWPSEWVSLFDRWIQGGFMRLSPGTAKDLRLTEDRDLGIFTLSCTTDVPATNSNDSIAWFESEFVAGETIPAYRLCVLPGEDLSAPPSIVGISAAERVDGPIPQQGITVIDAAGTHVVLLPSA